MVVGGDYSCFNYLERLGYTKREAEAIREGRFKELVRQELMRELNISNQRIRKIYSGTYSYKQLKAMFNASGGLKKWDLTPRELGDLVYGMVLHGHKKVTRKKSGEYIFA